MSVVNVVDLGSTQLLEALQGQSGRSGQVWFDALFQSEANGG